MADKKGSAVYPGTASELRVPKTPLEARQGYHPKNDELVWKTPPTRQLSRQKRQEYGSEVRERFYDDYIGERTVGDAKNEVLTGLSHVKFDPAIYRANAYQGLAYDPLRRVPAGLDLHGVARVEKIRERQREMQGTRQRRISDSFLVSRPTESYWEPVQTQLVGLPTLPPVQTERPRSALQKDLDTTLNPDIIPGVEDWLSGASKKEQEVANNFFRTVSSQGRRPDPAVKASVHRTRVRSAVMTPSRKEREQKHAQSTFNEMAREPNVLEQQPGKVVMRKEPPDPKRRLRRTSSEKTHTAKGSMFTATKQQPSHFTVHPSDWASEAVSPHKPNK